MRPCAELLVLTDTQYLDYETLATHLWRVSYREFREDFTLLIDTSNGPLATLLEQYVQRECVESVCRVSSLPMALGRADSVLLFASPYRTDLFKSCLLVSTMYDIGTRNKPLKLHTVIHEDTNRG